MPRTPPELHRDPAGKFRPRPGARGFRTPEPRIVPAPSTGANTAPETPTARRPYKVPPPAGSTPETDE